ncbi:iron-containing redox enzyme family protein [Polyangium sp. 15x6]|uniref:iron-containing redox enzyme family protein n=1 Tax=Polyangium sp. 15x6 TaxID=3042687 RepID=UPI00249A6F49|nr:iron-containing redox enzyme family protein [Polyangium sp. 15x6]MDI3283865.1 iron-containing redox enzyme family protein [Polyangium sp. 15x6]
MQHKKRPRSDERPKIPAVDDYDFFARCLEEFGESNLFADIETWLVEDNPYRRPLRPHVFKYLDFGKPLAREELLTYTSLTACRTLLTIYESDFILLPRRDLASKRADLDEFYGRRAQVLGAIVRPWLESYLFGFLDDAISISGRWTLSSMREYFESFVAEERRRSDCSMATAILTSDNPQHAARTCLVQLAGDFLLESSAMGRNVGGSYGPLQSEMFKILIDELGYGVHRTRHSSLYEATMESVGLASMPHTYWQFYLTSSLLLNNYYNYVCRNHGRFFRYIGALFQAETGFIEMCRRMADTLRKVFGPGVDVRYFQEHAHIDQHHSRMVFDKMILPAVEMFGEGIIPDIVRGFEEGKFLTGIANQDFLDQVVWSDGSAHWKLLAPAIHRNIEQSREKPKVQRFIEPRGELSVTHVHDGDELCFIQSGIMRFVTGHERSVLLHAGEGTVIRRNRLHGAIIESEECTYDIHSIGDYEQWLS